VVTLAIPNYYKVDGTPNPPTVTSTTGWPAAVKKKKKNKHRNIITSQAVGYDPANTQTVKYYKGNPTLLGKDATKFYREVNGVATVIADNVSDFSLSVSEDTTYVSTSIAFATRFRPFAISGANPTTTLKQRVELRNFQIQ
jgi:hypothetical protein